jgi:formamidopyrimidine-DNA glycosylase
MKPLAAIIVKTNMPELPEVETVVRGLRETVLGQTIAAVELNAPPTSIVVGPVLQPATFEDILTGRSIKDVSRRGKNILIRLSGDVTLWAHLKMTGHFFYLPQSTPRDKHDLAVFSLSDGNGCPNDLQLRFNDYRRFGRLRLFTNSELWRQPGLASLGPEPLEIGPEEFVALCRRRPRMIKPALLDQSFLAGIGNIYADESLWAARIHPRKLSTRIASRKLAELHGHLQRLLRKSISLMGTSVDSYSGVNGQPGRFQKYLLAYNRETEPCKRCGHPITRERIGSRSAHYCRRCQRVR